MSRRKKRQHKCKSLREYRRILAMFNGNSAVHFREHGWYKLMLMQLNG